MNIKRIASLMGLILSVFAAASYSQSVQADFDKSFNFMKLKTFNFAIQQRNPEDPLSHDSLNDGRIKTALESKLMASGYRTANAEAPDFAVAYYVTTKNKFDLREYGYGAPRWFGGRDIRVDQYTEGTLIVDLIDVTTKQLVWRGRASGTVELKGVDKKINKSVEKLVARFLKDTRRTA
ncbi:MAG: DUF4136 domain-containing protein [Chloracidobacterium sp.]|nr:DUF4136 domain-containing protein [Chloracidobacterium sp.]